MLVDPVYTKDQMAYNECFKAHQIMYKTGLNRGWLSHEEKKEEYERVRTECKVQTSPYGASCFACDFANSVYKGITNICLLCPVTKFRMSARIFINIDGYTPCEKAVYSPYVTWINICHSGRQNKVLAVEALGKIWRMEWSFPHQEMS